MLLQLMITLLINIKYFVGKKKKQMSMEETKGFISRSGLVQTRPVAEDPAVGPHECRHSHTDARPHQ